MTRDTFVERVGSLVVDQVYESRNRFRSNSMVNKTKAEPKSCHGKTRHERDGSTPQRHAVIDSGVRASFFCVFYEEWNVYRNWLLDSTNGRIDGKQRPGPKLGSRKLGSRISRRPAEGW